MTQTIGIHKILCSGPADLAAAAQLIESGALHPDEIVAVMGKTEGNGCVNDYTREDAASAWCHFLALHLACTSAEVEQRVALVMSGGTEGVLSPHFTVFTRSNSDARFLSDSGAQIVIFGPGDDREGHAANESLDESELDAACRIQLAVVRELLGVAA